ncbi:MAG TPA: hypothetical protein VLE99_00715 [Candidatus Saccharimonadales bacterium]|nr:hypothetical protein [Candidatus Saccharimonadales bacterium]
MAGGVYAWHRHGAVPRAETTSKEPSAQSNFTGGKGHQSNPSANTNQGGATDNHGDSSTNSGATGTASSSGVVTVTSPASDALLSSGDTLRGTATGQSKVQYRLIDDTVGVIAQGSLDVVDGRYSGTLQFTAHAKTGRLDVFTYDSQFQETNEVQLPVELGG